MSKYCKMCGLMHPVEDAVVCRATMCGSLDALRHFLGDMKIRLPVGRVQQLVKDLRTQLSAAQVEVFLAKRDRNEWNGRWAEEQTKRVNTQGRFDRDGIAMVALTTQYELLAEERNKLQAEVERLNVAAKGRTNQILLLRAQVKRLKPLEQAARVFIEKKGDPTAEYEAMCRALEANKPKQETGNVQEENQEVKEVHSKEE